LSMPAKDTRAVYPLSNRPFNRDLNASFTLAAMALTWKAVLELARTRLDMDEDAFRALLLANRVSSANCTNWKAGRPIPVGRYALLAGLLRMSIDELHGRGRGDDPPPDPPINLEPKSLVAEISALDDSSRRIIHALIAKLRGTAPAAATRSKKR
jgi:hypothetical protein